MPPALPACPFSQSSYRAKMHNFHANPRVARQALRVDSGCVRQLTDASSINCTALYLRSAPLSRTVAAMSSALLSLMHLDSAPVAPAFRSYLWLSSCLDVQPCWSSALMIAPLASRNAELWTGRSQPRAWCSVFCRRYSGASTSPTARLGPTQSNLKRHCS